MRNKLIGLYAVLISVNVVIWGLALLASGPHPVVLGTALLAYTLGLRHAVDADHIAAIDNATRKLMQSGQRPLTVGLYFSLGHSTVVFLASAGIAITASALEGQFQDARALGGLIGTIVSAGFLFAIAIANILVLAGIYRCFQRVRQTGEFVEADLEALGIIGDRMGLDRGFWRLIAGLNANLGLFGIIIVGIFVLSWVVSALIYHIKGYDRIEITGAVRTV